MDSLLKDLGYAVRTLVQRPLFTMVAVLSLAIGLGATTAMFSVVDVLAFRPLPGIDGWERAVELGRGRDGRGFDTFGYPDFLDIREGVPVLEEVAGWRSGAFSVGTEEGGVRVGGQYVSANYFEALDVTPARGRFFAEGEDAAEAPAPVVVVSDHFWRTRLEAAPDVVGREVRVNRRSFTVVGVTPPGFGGHFVGVRTDLYLPLGMVVALDELAASTWESRGSSWMQVVGRLAPGGTVAEANAQVGALFERLQGAHPDTNRGRTARVIPLGPIPGGGRAPALGFLGALMGLVTLVLLVTCSNVAGMFLARAAAREREIAIRLALGSGRGRLVRQLVTEVVVLFLLGGAGGVVLAYYGMGLVDVGALPIPVEFSLDLRPDLRVLGGGLVLALVTGLAFGLAPALQSARTDVLPSLKAEAGGGGGQVSRLRKVFAAGQVGLSLVLLVAAGLFIRSLQNAATVPTGFDPRNAYVTTLDLNLEGYDEASGIVLQERLRARLAAIPGVEAAALGNDLPLDMSSHGRSIRPEGWEGADGRDALSVETAHVSAGWFGALAIPVLRGRVFDGSDGAGGERVAVVSRTLAERVWPGEDPVGRRFHDGREEALTTVVGVVEDTPNQTLMEGVDPFVYRPLTQRYDPAVSVVVRSARPHGEIAGALRAAILDVDPSVSLTPVRSVDRLTSIGVLPQRIGATVAGFLGLVAVILSGLGVYGVVAFMVTGRTREIGIRMALGAGEGRVLLRVLRDGLMLALPGLAVGAVLAVALAFALGRIGVLLGVAPSDPVTFLGVAGVLLAVVLVACSVPARRASRVPPSEALRHE